MGIVGILALVGYGSWLALFADRESVYPSSKEIVRYQEIRRQALDRLIRGSVILSDRSDKIFFPVFVSVSPVPPIAEILTFLTESDLPLYLFSTTLDDRGQQEWKKKEIHIEPQFHNGNQTMYRLKPLHKDFAL